MSEIKDGGPAFPVPFIETRDGAFESAEPTGMSLRDYFAGQALIALLQIGSINVDDLAADAYLYADALLDERGKD